MPYEILKRILIERGAVVHGTFQLKAGEESPVFINIAQINTPSGCYVLADAMAKEIMTYGPYFTAIFGPAYKGIPLAVNLSQLMRESYGREAPWAFDRKEEKDHGEGGQLVGADLTGERVLIVDDVVTSGGSISKAAETIIFAGGLPVAAVVVVDRRDNPNANVKIGSVDQVPVHSLFTLQELLECQ